MLATLRISTCLCMYDMQKKKWLFFLLFSISSIICVSWSVVISSQAANMLKTNARPQRIERRRMNEKKKTKVESLVKESFSTLKFFFSFQFCFLSNMFIESSLFFSSLLSPPMRSTSSSFETHHAVAARIARWLERQRGT